MSEVESQEKSSEEELPLKAKTAVERAPSDAPIKLGPRYNLVPTDLDRSNRNRVKLYICKNSRTWEDAGTGHVGFSRSAVDDSHALVFRLESSEENRLESIVKKEGVYQKQQETLIVWTEDSVEIALSFQEQDGCDDFYAKLANVMGKEPDADVRLDESDSSLSDAEDDEKMPPIQLSRLFELEFYMKKRISSTAAEREKVARYFEAEGQISKLIDLFQMLEDMEDMAHLRMLYTVVRSLILLNQGSLLNVLFDDENLRDVIGMLEYEPAREKPANHRVFLYGTARFREILPIADDELRAKIHKVFRVQFIKDQCMPPPSIFEENPTAALSAYLHELRVDICQALRKLDFAGKLISELKKGNIAEKRRRDLMLLFTEFLELNLAPGSSDDQREWTFTTVFSRGIIPASYPCISNSDPAVQLMTVETISKLVAYDPTTVVNYMLQQGIGKPPEDTLVARLALLIFADKDPNMPMGGRVVEILRHLLAPDVPYQPEQEKFAVYFYRNVIPCIIAPLLNHFQGGRLKQDSYFLANKTHCVIHLLKICVQQHVSRIRAFLVDNDLLTVILGLLQCKHHFVAINALKLLRDIVSTEDVFLLSYIVRKDLFAPVIACLKKQRFRNNLLLSVILELFEHIALDDVNILLDYVMEKYGNALDGLLGGVYETIRNRYARRKKIEEEEKVKNEDSKREMEEKWFDENDDSPAQSIENATSPDTFVERPKAATKEETSIFNPPTLRLRTPVKFQIQSIDHPSAKEVSKVPEVVEAKPLVEYGGDSSDSDENDGNDEDPLGLKEEKSVVPTKPSTPFPASRGSKRSAIEWDEEENEADGAKKPC